VAFKRDLFTGKLVETEDSPRGREVIFREEIPPCRDQTPVGCNPYRRPWVSEALALSNPAQYKQFNQAMRDQGINPGAYYRPDGMLVCESRAARNDALRFNHKIDRDGGYGDHC
jgi:hypothetical protein